MSTVQENLVHSNKTYVASKPPSLPLPPAKHYLVLTCMDARIDPAPAFGISLGDAHVVRNAGGSAKEALRSIVISEQLLGTKEVLVIKHTDCGMLTFKDEDAYGIVEKNLGKEGLDEVKGSFGHFLPFPNLEQGVKDDVAFLRASKAVPKSVTISGWVYDVKNGAVTHVV